MMKSLAAALCLAVIFPAAPAPSSAQVANPAGTPQPPLALSDLLRQAEALAPLETLIVARDGSILIEEGFHGHSTTAPTNVKSVSKSIIAALVGIAVDRGLLEGPEQKIAPLLGDKLPADSDPRLHDITIGNLLSMQAGLQRTSGPNYGRWVASRDWVRAALAQPFVDDPGGGMLYSTGNSHLLSAILTRESGRSTLALAHDWLAPLDGFAIADWLRDPQGIYLGGNQMAMSPRAMLAFGELYRNGGRAGGRQVIPADWIEQSWQPRTRSIFHDDLYGYGWFLAEMSGQQVAYAWGYGGQMIYVVPNLALTVVMTSADNQASARTGHRDALHALMRRIVTTLGAEAG